MFFLLAYFQRVTLDTEEVLHAYAVIDAYSHKMGNAMGENDAWIAAVAHVTGARLLTTDKDFDPLHPDFLIRDWVDPDMEQKRGKQRPKHEGT